MIAINGRFLTQRVTGVQRFALETSKAIDALLETQDYATLRGQIELLVPPVCKELPELREIEIRRCGRGSGYYWEQIELPRFAKGKLLLGLCGLGPISVRHQAIVVHDTTYLAVPQAFTRSMRIIYNIIVPLLTRRVEMLLAVSQFTRNEMAQRLHVDPNQVTVCWEGSDHFTKVAPQPEILARSKLAANGYFLVVGGAVNKNLPALLKAFRDASPNDQLLVLTGKRNPRVHAAMEIEQKDTIRQLGYVTEGELRALYESATALVYPSSYEGFGLPPVEAMATGCPVITSDQPALLEVCGNASLHYPLDKPAALTDLIRKVAGDETLRSELRLKGRQRASNFTWERTARLVLNACLYWPAPGSDDTRLS